MAHRRAVDHIDRDGGVSEGAPVTPPITTGFVIAKEVIDALCEEHGIERSLLLSASRREHLCWIRFLGMFVVNGTTDLTLGEIANLFGRTNHATVLHAIANVSNRCDVDSKFQAKVATWVKHFHDLQRSNQAA